MRITIRDIAEKAGLSKSTVANALKGGAQCSESTRDRVQALAREMGYRSNPLVSAHFANVRRPHRKGGFAATLAYLADSPREAVVEARHPHYAAYAGARARADELGFGLDVFCYEEPRLSWDRLRKILQSRNIHGVVFAPHRKDQVLLGCGWDGFSAVMIGSAIKAPKFNRVEFDHLGNMEELFGRLELGGSERVGLALPESIDERVRHQFRSAYGIFQDKRDEALRVPSFIARDWAEEPFREWFERHRPEVIITVYDQVRQWLRSMGRRVPEDVRLAAPVLMKDALDYTGCYLPLELLGRAAIDLVSAQLYLNERGLPRLRSTTMIMGEWRAGRTS